MWRCTFCYEQIFSTDDEIITETVTHKFSFRRPQEKTVDDDKAKYKSG